MSEESYYQEELSAEEEEWCPSEEDYGPFLLDEKDTKKALVMPSLTPSQFVEVAFRMPSSKGEGYEPFSFDGRRHMRRVYDSPARRILLMTARQVEKSTCLGNMALTYSCLVPGHRTLYVSPSSTQTKTFSSDRLREPIETSDILKAYTNSKLSMNVFEKQFVNFSKITLRYAFLNADRTRGIPAWKLLLDEFQDILSDNIPVIEQCTSHAPEIFKKFIYAGTPKSLDNNIEYYRSRLSTQGEWVIPCDACGSKSGAGRYWNILGEKNIGKNSLICEHCGRALNPQHPEAQWAFMTKLNPPKIPFESYRIPQLMVPWKPWEEIIMDYTKYPRGQFYNEVLGLSFDSGMRPLSMAHVEACCDETVSMFPDELEQYEAIGINKAVFAGIDWGTGENSYTVISLGTYVNNKFRIFYIHKCEGLETEPPIQLALINELIYKYNVSIVGSDYGGGFDRNDALIRKFGPKRIQKYQYFARIKKKVEYDNKLLRWKIHRTECMSDLFNAIKRQQIVFPRWREFATPYAQEMCNIYSEYNETLRQIQYDHNPDKPDDSFHSVLYCFLASMIKYPRPDIMAPLREEPTQGALTNNTYTGPVNQG